MILDRKNYYAQTLIKSLMIFFKRIVIHCKTLIRGHLSDSIPSVDIKKIINKGYPYLMTDQDGALACTSCQKCVEICPTNCIEINSKERGERPETFEINMIDCILCGYCEDICPDQAIFMGDQYYFVGNNKDNWKWGIDRLVKSETES